MPPRAPSFAHKIFRLALVMLLVGFQVAQAALQTAGQWTAKKSMSATAINLNLVPGGTSPYHSRIIWWDSSSLRGMWGWRLQADTCGIWSDSNFVDITSPSFPTPPTDMNIFCSGATTLPDGRLIVVGGNEPGETGITKAAIFDADAAAWTALSDMANRRWYPTATVMADGRVFVSGGSKYFHMLSFGGQRTGDSLPSDSTLRRFGTTPNGLWDSGIASPTAADPFDEWPAPRSGHAVQDGSDYASSMFMFGGQNQNGVMLNDMWWVYREEVPQGTEYEYRWIQVSPESDPAPPTGRRDHVMVRFGVDSLLVFGGRTADSTNAEVWTLIKDEDFGTWSWSKKTPSGSAPLARYGHTAVLDAVHQRVLLYGGSRSIGGAASDTLVWSLSYAVPNMRWSNPVMRTSASPGPRFATRASLDPVSRKRAGGQDERRALLFGGVDENGTLPSDLWALWFSASAADTAVEWKQISTVSGSPPAGRYFHASDIDLSQARLVLVGGKLSGGTTDSTAWVAEFDSIGANSDYHGAKWRQLTNAYLGGGRANHTFLYPREPNTFPRHPEIFSPGTGNWTSLTSSLLHQDWYPPTFVSPNGNLFDACPIADYTWTVSPSGGSWSKLPNAGADVQCGSAVMYKPGRIMRGGGEDHANGTLADSITQVIDLAAGTPSWSRTYGMLVRTNHNFVVLPTGNVMVLGGTQVGRNNSNPVQRPQMWRPDTTTSGLWVTGDTGADGRDTLAKDPAVRGYHSTAVLLPDGRILSAGGNDHADQTYATLYSPPYLFKSNGLLAARPNVTGAMTNLSWAAQDDDTTFFVYVADTTHIQKVSMIRAPATTHSFDQSQRYLPVTFRKRAGRLELEAPADSMAAPPGYYQLFVSGSVDGKDVPALARWVHVGRDVTPGSTLNFQIDWVATTSLGAYWTANADDNAEAASGRSTQNDFRYKLSSISTETDWGLSSAMTEPSPSDPGTSQDATFSGFSPCSTYYFAARSRDDVGNLSPIPSEVSATMLGVHCNNLVARVGGGLAALRGRRVATTADGDESAEIASALIVETRRAGNGGWRVVVRQADDASNVSGLSSDRDVEIQDAAGAGWSTSRSFDPSTEESEIGLCRLRDGGRTVLKNFYLSGIPASFRTSDGTYEIPEEERLESVPTLADGDSLVMEFDPIESDDEASQWYLMAARVGAQLLTSSGPRPETERQDVPRVFALRQNQPNPFASTTRIAFDLPVRITAQVEIFDLQGRRVRTVASGERAAGQHFVDWDRRDDDGNVVRPGVYLYSIKAGNFREKKTMVLLK